MENVIRTLIQKDFTVDMCGMFNDIMLYTVRKPNRLAVGKLYVNVAKNEIVSVSKSPRIAVMVSEDEAIDFFLTHL